MTFVERKWDLLRACHEALLDMIGKDKLITIMDAIHKTGMYLALAYADYRCQGCGKGEKLSLQHLIKNTEKKYADHIRFFKMRYHWQNIIILCSECHIRDDKLASTEDTFLTIPDEKIHQIKLYFQEGSTNANAPMSVVNDIIKDIKSAEMSILKPHEPKKIVKMSRPKVIPYFGKKSRFETYE